MVSLKRGENNFILLLAGSLKFLKNFVNTIIILEIIKVGKFQAMDHGPVHKLKLFRPSQRVLVSKPPFRTLKLYFQKQSSPKQVHSC